MRNKEFTNTPCPTITVGANGTNSGHYKVEVDTDISRFAIAKQWDEIKPGQSHEKRFNLKKPDPRRPCQAITATGGNLGSAAVVHPFEKRKFTIPELKLLSSFPEDFVLTGTYAQQWERVGRSVPPVMMFHIASAVRDNILCKLK